MPDSFGNPCRRARLSTRFSLPAAIVLSAALLPAVAATASASSPDHHVMATAASGSPCSTDFLTSALHLPQITVSSAVPVTDGSYTPPGTTKPITGLPDFCAVTLTQPDTAGNPMHDSVWLPAKWTGRFQGIGGSGYSCGPFYTPTPGLVSPSLQEAIEGGYASAATDCGLPQTDTFTGAWALGSDGRLDWPLIDDYAYSGIHDMTVAGKAVTAAYYARTPSYSYFDGCSAGGREALAEAQRYAPDYNGIVAGSPIVNMPSLIPGAIWPALVMNQLHDALPTCKEDAFTESVVKACDALDGVTDGIIGDPGDCRWNARSLIGFKTPCGTITAADAEVMNMIRQGPQTTGGRQLWYGLERGASPDGLAPTNTSDGVTTVYANPIPVAMLGTWLQRDPNWDWTTLTFSGFDRLFTQSLREFSPALATDDPDLSAFKSDGGKVLIWHGLADELVPTQGSIQYYQQVQRTMGGAAAADSFARLFLAPGAAHCADAAGPAPSDPLAAVVAWVEQGKAPQSIPAALTDPSTGIVTMTRPLCAYPLVARYTGHGSTNEASNFTCSRA